MSPPTSLSPSPSSPHPRATAALLLLGGHSTRMGTPKHLLVHPISGLPLYLHTLRMLIGLNVFEDGVWVGCRGDQRDGLVDLPEGVNLIIDDTSITGSIGPATGILRAHSLHPNLTFLLLAIDLPFISPVSILHLISSYITASPSVPVMLYLHPSDSNPEPLFSVWSPPALDRLEENCEKGKSGPCRAAKDVLGGKVWDGPGGGGLRVGQGWEEVVKDADTREEWEEAVRMLKGGNDEGQSDTSRGEETNGKDVLQDVEQPIIPPSSISTSILTPSLSTSLPSRSRSHSPASSSPITTPPYSHSQSASMTSRDLDINMDIVTQVPFVVPERRTVSFEEAMSLVRGVVEDVRARRAADGLASGEGGTSGDLVIPVSKRNRSEESSGPLVGTKTEGTNLRLMSTVSAVGYRSASVHCALYPFPLFDNSAMDGYLVRSTSLTTATEGKPVEMKVIGRITAGDIAPSLECELESTGSDAAEDRICLEIMTGGEFPPPDQVGGESAWDAVVKVEDTTSRTDETTGDVWVAFSKVVNPGNNRRRRGEQIQEGQEVGRAGEVITPEKVMLLTAVGIKEIEVIATDPRATISDTSVSRPRRRVAIIATGNEVVSLDDLEGPPRNGQVIDSVTPYLRALLFVHDCEPVVFPPAGDDPGALSSLVSAAINYVPPFDIIVTVAGVSIGTADNIASVLTSIGAKEIFHGVKIKPGRPVMLSMSQQGTPILSLPGNPLAAVVNMRSFGLPLLGIEAWSPIPLDSMDLWDEKGRCLPSGVDGFFPASIDSHGRLVSLRSGICNMKDLVKAEAWVRASGHGSPSFVHMASGSAR